MHLAHVNCILFAFPKRIWWLLFDSVVLYQLVSRDKPVVNCCCWICTTSFHQGWEFCHQFCFTLRGDGEVWSFPWFSLWKKSLHDEKRLLYLQKICKWESSEEKGKIKDREKVHVCIQKLVNTLTHKHTQSYKDPSGEPTLKVNAAPGCN